ncbi:hypothetical protein TanjilG_19576 [Lupinus angustifolius]|uniref:DUF668 domain-containing protein n=1 Tax=Lupinus angustifolius TaxID=3871 RepID=A0A1J7G9L0_LUPAN|nr:PREDICTED: uncharacterized protein LOC109328002 [Lupinus angustifolius]OIV97029.1 hypothetical protein TanjilG_19576 [Lupinus angustifolius]
MGGGSIWKIELLVWLSQVIGGLCSKSSQDEQNVVVVDVNKEWQHGFTIAPQKMERNVQMQEVTDEEDLYDGIPRFTDSFLHKSRSIKSRQVAVAKVSEVSSRISRVGTVGFVKAVEVLDTLGSSMTNLNAGSGFVSGAAIKGNEISILAFEVANTIVKGYNLLQSLSRKSIRRLKEDVLLSEGVQDLVSNDVDELLRIVAADKRRELKVFSDEVIRFGNRSKDPQWHNLERYFEKINKESNAQGPLKDETESIMHQLVNLVQYTAELYHELHALDRFEQDYERESEEEDKWNAIERGNSLAFLRVEIKCQKKQIKYLKKRSLWSRSLEEVIEKLVDIVHFLHLEVNNVFGSADGYKPLIGHISSSQRLGPAGLALHYANIVLQIDNLVTRSNSMPASSRDSLYQSLTPSIKSALRSLLPSFHVREELTVADIKDEIEKTLHWLVPISAKTTKAHHGFGWVGEWANTDSEADKKTSRTSITRIETFYHADKDKVENYILQLLLWLHCLAIKSKAGGNAANVRSAIKSLAGATLQKINQQSTNTLLPLLTIDEKNMLQKVRKKKQMRGISKSLDLDYVKSRLKDNIRLTKSKSLSTISNSKELTFNKIYSKLHMIDFGIDKDRAMDVIDRLDEVR